MTTVNSILPLVKANSLTYYNLNDSAKKDFKNLYAYLKKHKDKEISSFSYFLVEKTLKECDKFSDYVRKYKAMDLIATSIINK